MCEKPIQWTANSSVFTHVLEFLEWFVFDTFQDLFFILRCQLRTSFMIEILCSTRMAFDKTKELDNLVM